MCIRDRVSTQSTGNQHDTMPLTRKDRIHKATYAVGKAALKKSALKAAGIHVSLPVKLGIALVNRGKAKKRDREVQAALDAAARTLDVHVLRGRGLHNVRGRLGGKMDPYVKLSWSSSGPGLEGQTEAAFRGHTDPEFEEILSLVLPSPDALLKVEVFDKSEFKLKKDRVLGEGFVDMSASDEGAAEVEVPILCDGEQHGVIQLVLEANCKTARGMDDGDAALGHREERRTFEMRQQHDDHQEHDDQNPAAAIPPPPPPPQRTWNEYTDPDSSRAYWHCPETQITTWECPLASRYALPAQPDQL
eukprot:TRINITY_DN20334_c0_g1_i1.p1 TRINITY_DN20334_c0_g1~~TRINITY_DN20334_c0_g1_i1.p1  ORF type:complete len:304 (-),score=48.13 TRINITY_DN20334_c0_g1_i1:3-914(-)